MKVTENMGSVRYKHIAGTVTTDGRNTEGALNDAGVEYGCILCVVDDRRFIVWNGSNASDKWKMGGRNISQQQ
jgi:hypothetical protein